MLSQSNISDTDVNVARSGLSMSARTARRQLAVVVAVTVLAGATAGFLTWLRPTQYVSTVTMVVPTQNGATDAETAVRSIRALLKSVVVGADLKAATGASNTPQQIVNRISATRPPGSGVLAIAVTDRSAATSRAIAAQLPVVFTKRLSQVTQAGGATALPALTIRAWGAGVVTTVKASPAVVRNTLIGLGLGLLLGIMIVAIRRQRHPVLTSAEQAEVMLGVPVLATIPSYGRRSSRPWNRTAAIQLALSRGGDVGWAVDARSIAVATPHHDRAQREIVLALARALAADGHDVTIVDADLERGVVSSMLRATKPRGLSDLLKRSAGPLPPLELLDINFRGDKSLEGADTVGRVRLLPVGQDRDAFGLLRNARLRKVMERLTSDAFVIVSAPSIPGPVPSNQLLQSVDAILLVATLRDVALDDACATADAVRSLAAGRPVAALLTGGDGTRWPVTPPPAVDAELRFA